MVVEHVIRFYGVTDVGKKRDHNEDAFYYSETEGYGVIADGMGGRLYGEVAANMTVDLLRERFATFFPSSVRDLARTDQARCADMVVTMLDDWIRDVNRAVWNKGQVDERYREMGTTLALVYALPSLAVVAHVGDSRVYQVSGETMTQVTDDHSFVNSQVQTGAMTPEEAQQSAQRNIITRAIGTGDVVKPDFRTVHTKIGDKLLLCSDGLTDMVEDEVIAEIVTSGRKPDEILAALVAEANANGGRDNITILMVDYAS